MTRKQKNVRATDAKEVGVENPAEENVLPPERDYFIPNSRRVNSPE
jgi:hypothetical protein